jgi:toxin ParE1/3/4
MKLQTFAARGVARDDLLPGLRITHFRKRTIIAYLLDREVVSIVASTAARTTKPRWHRAMSE